MSDASGRPPQSAGQELTPQATALFGDEEVALVDLLDRLLAGGVVLAGDLTIALAGVDLVRVSLRALITSITPVERPPSPEFDARARPGIPDGAHTDGAAPRRGPGDG